MIGRKKTIFIWTVSFDFLWNNSEEECNGYSHRIWGQDASGMSGCLGSPLPGKHQVRPQAARPWPWPCLPSAECQRPRRRGGAASGMPTGQGGGPRPHGVTRSLGSGHSCPSPTPAEHRPFSDGQRVRDGGHSEPSPGLGDSTGNRSGRPEAASPRLHKPRSSGLQKLGPEPVKTMQQGGAGQTVRGHKPPSVLSPEPFFPRSRLSAAPWTQRLIHKLPKHSARGSMAMGQLQSQGAVYPPVYPLKS